VSSAAIQIWQRGSCEIGGSRRASVGKSAVPVRAPDGACGSSEWPGSDGAPVARWCYCRYRSLRGATEEKRRRPQILLGRCRPRTRPGSKHACKESRYMVHTLGSRLRSRMTRQREGATTVGASIGRASLRRGDERGSDQELHGQVFNAKPVSRARRPVAAFLQPRPSAPRQPVAVGHAIIPVWPLRRTHRGPFACSQHATTPSGYVPVHARI
jgi:hypothetical protein